MKSILKALLSTLLIVSVTVHADESDVFEETSCAGDLMTGERALELLGSNYSVNLAKTEADPNASVKGFARRRQKIAGAVGAWHEYNSSVLDITPYIFNSDGELGLKLYYKRFRENRKVIECVFSAQTEVFVCHLGTDAVGTGELEVKLTNSCLRVTSSSSSASSDTEWAYLLRF